MKPILIPSVAIQQTMLLLAQQIEAEYGANSYIASLSGQAGSLFVGNENEFQTAIGGIQRAMLAQPPAAAAVVPRRELAPLARQFRPVPRQLRGFGG